MSAEPSGSSGHEGEAGDRPVYSEIIITCTPQILQGMVAAYETAIAQAAGELPVLILWWGQASKSRQGTIVLEWLGRVPASFLHDLYIDEEVLDYCCYEDDRVSIGDDLTPTPPNLSTDHERAFSTNGLPAQPDAERSEKE